jgi:hypothetical protein
MVAVEPLPTAYTPSNESEPSPPLVLALVYLVQVVPPSPEMDRPPPKVAA